MTSATILVGDVRERQPAVRSGFLLAHSCQRIKAAPSLHFHVDVEHFHDVAARFAGADAASVGPAVGAEIVGNDALGFVPAMLAVLAHADRLRFIACHTSSVKVSSTVSP